jgi:transposase-like protein
MSGNGKTGRWRRCTLWCFFDALRVKIRDQGSVGNKAVYVALSIDADGKKDLLGIWVELNEGVKFWIKVMNEVRNRRVQDILMAVVDVSKGFSEVITAIFPQAIWLEVPVGCGAGVASYLPSRER